MKNINIPIVFSANNYYIPYTSTAIQSIIENADKDRQYIFYILYQEMSDNNIALLKKQVSLFPQFSINFINVTKYIDKYDLFTSRHISLETYFRLLIPELLAEYQKAIYLDGDMICCTDIASLYDINLENYLLAAVRDVGVSWYYSPNHSEEMKFLYSVLLHLKKPEDYFCAGMCILNIDLFRKTISTDEIFKLAASRQWQVHDQDVLNYLAENKTFLLPFHWNFMYTPNAKYLPEYLQNEYLEAKENPRIIHYKPWTYKNYIPHFDLFWKYATRTPFIDIIIENMKEKGTVSDDSFESFAQQIILNIKKRAVGLRFILIDCPKAWLSRDKKKRSV